MNTDEHEFFGQDDRTRLFTTKALRNFGHEWTRIFHRRERQARRDKKGKARRF